MISKIISNQLLLANGVYLGYPNTPVQVLIDVPNTEVTGPYWVTPSIQNGKVLAPATQPAANSSTPPTPASCKTLRLKELSTGRDLWIAILNSDEITSSTYANYANGVGGSTPVMPTVTIPQPIIQNPPASSTSTSNTFYITCPPNPNTRNYACAFPWINGLTPPAFPTGNSTVSALVTALNTTYGTLYNATFTRVGSTNSISVVSTVSGSGTQILNMGMDITLVGQTYSVTLPSYTTPVACDGILINGVNASFRTGGIAIGTANPNDLINSLIPLFEPSAAFTIVGTAVHVTTVQVPTYLTIGGVNTSLTFA